MGRVRNRARIMKELTADYYHPSDGPWFGTTQPQNQPNEKAFQLQQPKSCRLRFRCQVTISAIVVLTRSEAIVNCGTSAILFQDGTWKVIHN
jgi:hypothetical protein